MKQKSTDFMIEQQIFLGGKVSHKHAEFMKMAKMSADYADLYFLVERIENWEKEQDLTKVILNIIETLGEIDFLRSTTELTRLSMIMGDTREHYDMGKVMDELRASRSDTQT